MKCICDKRCIIGEGPIWNDAQQRLYFTNGLGNEIFVLDPDTGYIEKTYPVRAAAIAFDRENRLIISRPEGVFYLNPDNSLEPVCSGPEFDIRYANDMKVGPDGRLYVGTQSTKRLGLSDRIDGKLYSISKSGEVKVLLDNLRLSNGMDWSMDEKRFYHTDSETGTIREYAFEKNGGTISFTGRELRVPGVDGFCIDRSDRIYATCWGAGSVAVIDTARMQIVEFIPVPAKAPASCCFWGRDMKKLAVVTASYQGDLCEDPNAGYTFSEDRAVGGRLPYLFGGMET